MFWIVIFFKSSFQTGAEKENFVFLSIPYPPFLFFYKINKLEEGAGGGEEEEEKNGLKKKKKKKKKRNIDQTSIFFFEDREWL